MLNDKRRQEIEDDGRHIQEAAEYQTTAEALEEFVDALRDFFRELFRPFRPLYELLRGPVVTMLDWLEHWLP